MSTSHGDLVRLYEQWQNSWGASPRTVTVRVRMAKRMLKRDGVQGLTVDKLTAFLAELAADPHTSPWTLTTYHSHLTDFCGWLHASGHLTSNPMRDVRKIKRPKSQPRPVSDADLRRVLDAARGTTRDWILLALHAGLRAHEVAKIQGQDVNPNGIFVLGKGRVPATLPCHPEIAEMAGRYPEQGYWFPGGEDGHVRTQYVSQRVGVLFKSMGIDGSIHRVRHSFGTRLLRSGAHIRQVQTLMRHSSLETTALYTAVDEDELRTAILGLPPVA